MSHSPAPPSSSNSGSSQPDTLLQNEIIIEDHPKDTLPHSAESPSSLLHEDTQSTMLPYDRSRGRTVHIFDASNRNTAIGGLILTDGVTNANLYAMVEIIVIVTSKFTLQNESDVIVEKDSSPLQPGSYYIHVLAQLEPIEPFQLNNELILCRALSLQTGTRVQAFRDSVRLRDRRCVITGREYFDDNNWRGFEAAHIFPLAYENHWIEHNYGHWISTPPNGEEIEGGKINSVQNGILLRSDIHQLFDFYDISINPDDNYKVVCFTRDRDGIAGKHLDQRLLDHPGRPADQLLRWHFRQAVLTNMKGAGEPVFEHDFPPGSDIVGSILKGPKAASRMEFELFSRMATQLDLTE
ncbi:HNH endonuclease-domain-containing protein [Tricladium varicosporioides]|nr:HNH endonuclease-domain-containing protein [Hymenoscyphus varicosporioides]